MDVPRRRSWDKFYRGIEAIDGETTTPLTNEILRRRARIFEGLVVETC